MAALAHKFAGLISPLHGYAPVALGQRAPVGEPQTVPREKWGLSVRLEALEATKRTGDFGHSQNLVRAL